MPSRLVGQDLVQTLQMNGPSAILRPGPPQGLDEDGLSHGLCTLVPDGAAGEGKVAMGAEFVFENRTTPGIVVKVMECDGTAFKHIFVDLLANLSGGNTCRVPPFSILSSLYPLQILLQMSRSHSELGCPKLAGD